MNKVVVSIAAIILAACNQNNQGSPLLVKKVLPVKPLKEISGMIATDGDIWAITDKPKANIFKLDTLGNLLQEVTVKDVEATDVEAVTADKDYIYLGDVGDNNGDRGERQIIKVAKSGIGDGEKVETAGELIKFTFPQEGAVEEKKQNNYDCESLLSFEDSLYVFTKDREDKETRLYVMSKAPGTYTARLIDSFNSKGLVTDAAINAAGDEVALIGYHKGHKFPFILLFKDFEGNDFLAGTPTRIELANKEWDWQTESITYGRNNIVYFSSEGTKEVPATFYGIKRDKLMLLNKGASKKAKKKDKKDDDDAHMGKKGKLKF